jgi:ABC-2 type transport system permease protein
MTTLAAERTRTAATAALGHPAWRSTGLTGMGTLLRFLARRDRIRGLIWFVALVGTVVASAVSIVAVYKTPAQLADYAQVAQIDEAIKVIAGPGYGLDDPTQGAVVMNETEIYTLIAVALMAIFMITRHTRAEEETDRAEMVGAAPIGRLVPLLAACVWVSAISIAISAAITIGMLACGLPTAGSVAFGATTATFGLVFVGIAAVTAQVASSARAANAGAGAVLGIFFVLRGVGDIGNGWMSWLSPLGIAQAIRAYADERWWVLGILLALAALFGGRRRWRWRSDCSGWP